MAKITKESVLTISNTELLAIVRREEKGIFVYTTQPVNMDTIEKMLNHLVGGNETQSISNKS